MKYELSNTKFYISKLIYLIPKLFFQHNKSRNKAVPYQQQHFIYLIFIVYMRSHITLFQHHQPHSFIIDKTMPIGKLQNFPGRACSSPLYPMQAQSFTNGFPSKFKSKIKLTYYTSTINFILRCHHKISTLQHL